jgi:hypothetical protein
MPSTILKGTVYDKFSKEPIDRAVIVQNGFKISVDRTIKSGYFELQTSLKAKKSINIQAEGYKEQNFLFHTNGKEQVFYLEPLFTEEKPPKTATSEPHTELNPELVEGQRNEGEELKDETPQETTANKAPQQKENQGKQARKMKENHENRARAERSRSENTVDWEQRIMIGLLFVLFAAIAYFIYRMYKKGKPTAAPVNPGARPHAEPSPEPVEGSRSAVEINTPAPAPTATPSPRIRQM